jgi:polyisoprenoid-binding protein YceI
MQPNIRHSSVVGLASLAILVAAAPSQSPSAPAQAPASAKAGPLVCTIDDTHSLALFRVHHMGAGQFWGRFNDVAGNFAFEPGKAEGMKFDVTIKTDSVDTGIDALNKHLRSPDFFGVKDFPTMTFKSTGARKTGDSTYDVPGELTMHGVTKPIVAKLEFTGMSDMGKGTNAGFEATFTVKRSDFGMVYGIKQGAVGDDVRVVVALEGGVAK